MRMVRSSLRPGLDAPPALLWLVLALLALLALAGGRALGAQSYDPVGPQLDVPVATVEGGGWSLCFAQWYGSRTGPWMPTIESLCTGEKLMLACGGTGATELELLAAAPREEALEHCGDTATASHLANGAQWYHGHGGAVTDHDAWGFAAAGAAVNRYSCDYGVGTVPDSRLCWELGETYGGYRCGSVEDLNASPDWIKRVYRYTSAVFADGFETTGSPCRWSQTSGSAEDCAESLTLAFAPGCGQPVADQGVYDLDPDRFEVAYRLTWNDLRREWGYRLQVDYWIDFESENDWFELPQDANESALRSCVYPDSCNRTYRLIGHLGHRGDHGPDPVGSDVVSNTCTVYVAWD